MESSSFNVHSKAIFQWNFPFWKGPGYLRPGTRSNQINRLPRVPHRAGAALGSRGIFGQRQIANRNCNQATVPRFRPKLMSTEKKSNQCIGGFQHFAIESWLMNNRESEQSWVPPARGRARVPAKLNADEMLTLPNRRMNIGFLSELPQRTLHTPSLFPSIHSRWSQITCVVSVSTRAEVVREHCGLERNI